MDTDVREALYLTLNYVPGGATSSDKEISFGMGPIDLKYIKSGNGNHGVGVKISASAPWPRYSAGASWDVENAKNIEN